MRFQEAKIGSLKFKLVLLSFLGFLLFLVADAFLMDSVFPDLIPSDAGVIVSDVVAMGHPPPSCYEPPPSCPGRCDTDSTCKGTCYGPDYFKCGYCEQIGTDQECDGLRRNYVSCPAPFSTDPGGPTGYSCRSCYWGSADSTASFCSACFPPARHLPSGENDTTEFGQYTTFTATECCGDDTGELRNSLSQDCTDPGCGYQSNKYPFSSGASSRACCNNQNDGVYAATCYPPSQSYRIQDIGPSIVPDRNRHNVVVDAIGVYGGTAMTESFIVKVVYLAIAAISTGP